MSEYSSSTGDCDLMGDMPLLNLDEKGKAPEARLTKASKLRSMFMFRKDKDRLRAYHRAQCQDLLDGGTPYESQSLVDAGQPDTTNLNFGGAEQQLERAVTPQYRLVSSPEVMLTISTKFGPEEDRSEWNTVLAEEITRTLRELEQGAFQAKKRITKATWDGVAVSYWPDDVDFRVRASGLGHFYFDDGSDACEAEQECPISYEEYSITRLWGLIKNKETAESNGWNVEAATKAIRKATESTGGWSDWEKMMEDLKANDIAATTGPTIKIISGWVKEFDGTVSLYMTTEDDHGHEDFIYESRHKYKSMRQAFIMYSHGIGTNTKLHSIRGLGFKIYAFEQQRNRSLSKLIDLGDLASTLLFQAGDEGTMADIGLQYYGNLAVLPPNMTLVDREAPDLQRSVMPVLAEMERLRNDRVAGYSPENVFDGDQRKTKYEVSAALDQSAALSDSQLDFFYGPYDRELQETVRRMTRKSYVKQDPGGDAIVELKKRLKELGVPLEAFYQIDYMATKAVRVIGAGSAAAKTQSLARVDSLRSRMDDVGQANLDRDLLVDAVGSSNADRYMPKDGTKRTTVDTNIAVGENYDLLNQNPVEVQSSDKDLAHAREHLKPLIEAFEAEQRGEAPIEEIGPQIAMLYNHTADHVERISTDPTAQQEAAEMRQIMQRVGEVVSNGLKAAEKKAQEAPAEGEQQATAPDGQLLIDVEKHRAEMRMKREEFDQDQAMKAEAAQQKMAIADAEAAARITRTR